MSFCVALEKTKSYGKPGIYFGNDPIQNQVPTYMNKTSEYICIRTAVIPRENVPKKIKYSKDILPKIM